MEQKPSIGRIVHYFAYGTPNGEFPAKEPRAAVITEVLEGEVVSLCVLNPSGMFFNQNVTKGQEAGQWDWPARI